MEKKKYKKSENKNYSKHIIVLGILIFILIIINNILSSIYKKNTEEKPKLSYDNLTTVQEVIEYYESKYISEEESKDTNFKLDIYLNFAKMPYEEDETSNEEYYNKMIEDIAKVIRYGSFRMFDNENDINIEVLCENRKVKNIIINGMEDYLDRKSVV